MLYYLFVHLIIQYSNYLIKMLETAFKCVTKPVQQLVVHNFVGIMEHDTVITIRENMHVVVLNIVKIKFIQQQKCVLKVYVIITGTVHDQEPLCTGNVGDISNSRLTVTFTVVNRRLHISLGVNGVIKSPVSDRRNGHSIGKCVSCICLKSFESHKSTV